MRWILCLALLAVANVASAQSRWDVTVTAATGPMAVALGQTVQVPARPIHPFFPNSPSIHGAAAGAGFTVGVACYQAEVPDPANNGRFIYDSARGASWVTIYTPMGTTYSVSGIADTKRNGATFRTTPWQTSFGGSGTYPGGTFTVNVTFVP